MSAPDKKPTRKGRAVRPAADAPAAFQAGAGSADGPGVFNPQTCAERLDMWKAGGAKGAWLIRPPGGECVEVDKGNLKLISRAHGISMAKPENGPMSEFDRLLYHVLTTRGVECVVDKLAGAREGVREFNGARVYVKRGPRLVSPREGSWEAIRALVEGVLCAQAMVFYGWLKIAVQALRAGVLRPGQLLILIGPRGSGKSRIQHWIITELLGGKSEDPSGYMIGDTDFNEELFGAVHLLMEDPALREDAEAKTRFAARMKELTVNDKRRLHPKGSKALSFAPLWRPTLSLNDDEIGVLPFVSESLEDKLIILKAHHYEPPLGSGSNEERAAWEKQIHDELPAFLAWLLALEIPAELRDQRFGVRYYIAPEISAELHDLSPDARVLEALDLELWADEHGGRTPWTGNPTELCRILHHASSLCSHEARSLFRGPSPLGKILRRLTKTRPERVSFSRTGAKRAYCIAPEEWRETSPAGDAETTS